MPWHRTNVPGPRSVFPISPCVPLLNYFCTTPTPTPPLAFGYGASRERLFPITRLHCTVAGWLLGQAQQLLLHFSDAFGDDEVGRQQVRPFGLKYIELKLVEATRLEEEAERRWVGVRGTRPHRDSVVWVAIAGKPIRRGLAPEHGWFTVDNLRCILIRYWKVLTREQQVGDQER